MKNLLLLFIIELIILPVFSQSEKENGVLRGLVYQKDSLGKRIPLAYANVYWPVNMVGVITDTAGRFSIQKPNEKGELVLIASFVGFMADTVIIERAQERVEIDLEEARLLDEVVISKNRATNINSKISLMSSQLITEVGLQKLACCNIGESFESNATIDVGFSDAVSGAKKIRMLGLDGKYSQFLFENIPFMRGPESGFGLSHIPGPFMKSIQVSKGTSSVINGYESTTGQINVEYKKPADTDILYLNLFANSEGRYESNLTSGLRLNNNWAGMVFLHASAQTGALDHNEDGFYDKPLQRQINFLNRWEYNPDGLLHLQFGLEVVNETRIGGQLDFRGRDNNPEGLYGMETDISKLRIFAKLGYAFPENPSSSLGWINSFTYFDQNSLFGIREYNGLVKNYYSNLIWQSSFKNERNMISSGLSFQYDDYSESFLGSPEPRIEAVPGVFSQYSYSDPGKIVFMTGLRLDKNSMYGLLFTPRMHVKYNFTDNLILRATLGRAFRSPDIFAENQSLLASSRTILIDENTVIEKAWNSGISLSRHFLLPEQREASLSIDFYRTDFQDQMVTDLDRSASEVSIYRLDGKSFSNSFQADFTGEIFKGFDMTLAYRFNDVRVEYRDGLKSLPFTTRHKALFTTTYSTRFDKWKFDLTVQRNGKSRLPQTIDNPEEFRLDTESKSYFMVYAQVTRAFKHFELYTGVENLTAYRQKKAIVDPENPFGEYFDATMIWGPLTGRMFYGGLRYRIR